MEKTPCDIHLYDSDEYKNCIKDIVYENAQDEWIMLDPRFPNLKGLTPKRIDEFLENTNTDFIPETIYNTDPGPYLNYVVDNVDDEKIFNIYLNVLKEKTTQFPSWENLPNEFKNSITSLMFDEYTELYGFKPDESAKEYFKDYLQHVIVYDRDDIVNMCYDLGKQIEKKYPDKLHDSNSIFVTTPRGGYEVLSIFAYTNKLKKEQIPSHFRGISEYEYEEAKKNIDSYKNKNIEPIKNDTEIVEYYEKNNHPILPDNWLVPEYYPMYEFNRINTVFIIDDIIVSGQQIQQAVSKIRIYFNKKVEIIPVILVKRKNVEKMILVNREELEKTIYHTETVGVRKWEEARDYTDLKKKRFMSPKPELIEDYDKLITVRFPWGSPDGESDKILTTLYESRRGLERIERKQRRCSIEPDACELK